MSREDILKKLESIVSQEYDVEVLTEETDMRDDLEADSIGMLELVMDVEEAFDIDLSEVDFSKIEKTGDFVDIIEEKME
ncbi:MAG: phosphopantetheine-binding protein [Tissierellia bacterium]|nr:phosphopantetheine-binding protein [Tissierellia bacterium]